MKTKSRNLPLGLWDAKRKAASRKRLSLLHPCDLITLKRLDALCGGVLHTLEDDEATDGSFDAVVEDAELRADAKLCDLGFDKALARLAQSFLNLADAHRQRARSEQAALDQQLTEEVRLAAATTTPRTLKAGRL